MKLFGFLIVLFVIMGMSIVGAGDVNDTSVSDNSVSADVSVVSDNNDFSSIASDNKIVEDNNIVKSEKSNDLKVSDNNKSGNDRLTSSKSLKSDSSVSVTDDNYATYFDDTGMPTAALDNVNDIKLSGNFSNRNFIFSNTIAVSSDTLQARLYNSSFTFIEGSDGSSVSGLIINNTDNGETIFNLYGASGLALSNNTLIVLNSVGDTHAILLNSSSGNSITGNVIDVSGQATNVDYNYYGTFGTCSLSSIQGYKSSYNDITNNTIITTATSSKDGDNTNTVIGVEFCTDAFSYDDDESSANNINNNIFNTTGKEYAYSVRLNNKMDEFTVDNNTITTTADGYAYGIEYAYGSDSELANNTINVEATNMTYGIVVTTNNMGNVRDVIVENNTITASSNLVYLIELYGPNTVTVNNNTLTGTGARVTGIAGTRVRNTNITSNTIKTTGNSSKEQVITFEAISPSNTGINLQASSYSTNDDNTILNNNITTADLAGGIVYTINFNGTENTIRENTLNSTYKTGHKSINGTLTGNLVDTNYPINPDAVSMTINQLLLEVNQPGQLTAEVFDQDGNALSYGNVTFYIDNNSIGQASVLNGQATLNYTGTTAGNYTATAVYMENTVYKQNSITTTITVIPESTYHGIIYVSNNGTDSNDGSEISPKQTLESAIYAATKDTSSHEIIILDGTYNVNNLTISSKLKITGQENVVLDANNKGNIFTATDTLELHNIKFINGNSTDGGILQSTKPLTIINCTFENSHGVNGGAIRVSNETYIINSTFTNNTATSYAGAIYRAYSNYNLIIVNSNFTNNNGTTGNGGVITASGNGNLTVTNSTFKNNYARQGGAIHSSANAEITNSNFTNNSANNGGDLYFSKNAVLINITSINSSARNQASSIYFSGSSYTLNIENITINNSRGSTGVIYISNVKTANMTNMTITGTNISSNAVIYINNGKNITVNNSVFTNNTSRNRFIYIYNRNTNLTVNNTEFTDNSARNFIDNTGYTTIENSNFTNNTANTTDLFKTSTANKFKSINNTFKSNNLPVTITVNTADQTAYTQTPVTITVKTKDIYNTTINTGNITLTDGLNTYTSNITDNTTTINYTPYTAGINNITVTYTNTDNDYTNTTITKQYTISKTDIIITAEDITGIIDTPTQITANITTAEGIPVINGDITLDINGKITTIPVTNGSITYDTTFNQAGTVLVTLTYNGQAADPVTQTININVNKKDVTINIDQITAYVDIPATITATITTNTNDTIHEGIITFTDNNGNILGQVAVTNNTASLTATYNNESLNIVKITYNGTDTYNNATTQTTVTVNKIPGENITITINPINAEEQDTINITAKLTTNNQLTVNGGKLVFKINGRSIRDSNGKVIYVNVINGTAVLENFTVPEGWSGQTNQITATFYGNPEFEMTRSTQYTMNITKRTAALTITDNTSVKTGETTTLTARVSDTKQKEINDGKVVFKVNGRSVRDSNGKVIYADVINGTASLDYTVPEYYTQDNLNITCVYFNDAYNRSSANTTLLIKD